jgi:hypothetical protein
VCDVGREGRKDFGEGFSGKQLTKISMILTLIICLVAVSACLAALPAHILAHEKEGYYVKDHEGFEIFVR